MLNYIGKHFELHSTQIDIGDWGLQLSHSMFNEEQKDSAKESESIVAFWLSFNL